VMVEMLAEQMAGLWADKTVGWLEMKEDGE
jgi:hypothetical protein